MDLLKRRKLPQNFSNDIVDILRKMSFTNLLHFQILGSSSLKSQIYAGDFDAFERVPIKSVATAVKKFQQIVRSLMNTPLTYIGDIKCGLIKEWTIELGDIDRGKIVGYNPTAIRQRLEALYKNKVVSEEEYKNAMKSVKDRITPLELLTLKRELRFGLVRWTAKEILQGKKRLHDGRIYTLAEAIQAPTITKLDVISWVQGNRFTDFSVIYEFHSKGKVLNISLNDVEKAMRQNMFVLYKEGDYYKMAKRMFALAKLHNNKRILNALSPLFNGDLGRLYVVYGDLGTLEYLVENFNSLPKDKIHFEIDQFKNRLANVLLPSYLAKEPVVLEILEKMLNFHLYTENNAQLLHLIRELKDRLKALLASHSKKYLTSKKLLPIPKGLLP